MISKAIAMCALLATSVNSRSWKESTVGDMTIYSNAPDDDNYSKVVILLHGGSKGPAEWRDLMQTDRAQALKKRLDHSKIKYIAPKATHAGNKWYVPTGTSGCGINDVCYYDTASVSTSGDQLKAVVDAEKTAKGWSNSDNVIVAGFSEGGNMAAYLQLAKMTERLKAVIVLNGYPVPPLLSMPDETEAVARGKVSYRGSDMRWMLMYGGADGTFPAQAAKEKFKSILDKLGATDAVKINEVEEEAGHDYTDNGLTNMGSFIEGEDTYTFEAAEDGSKVLMASMVSSILIASIGSFI